MSQAYQISALDSDAEQLQSVAFLAKRIWQQHFTPIIGAQQVAYMLDKYQSATAIGEQIAQGVEYFVIQSSHLPVGYMALIENRVEGRMMLSKLYVAEECRGKGFGFQLLQYAEAICIERALPALWLTVNRDNDDSIAWYEFQGFTVIDEVKKDIGDGFYMDDFIMQKTVEFL